MADAAAAIEEELEALEALYPDDGLVVRRAGDAREDGSGASTADEKTVRHTTVSLDVAPRTLDDETQQYVRATLCITLGDDYPATPPTVRLSNVRGLDDTRQAEVRRRLDDACRDFSSDEPVLALLCETAFDTLTELNRPDGDCAFCLAPVADDADTLDDKSSAVPFIKLMRCYHCFHENCFARWWRWRAAAAAEASAEQGAHHAAASASEGRAATPTHLCPVCRVAIEDEDVRHVKLDGGEDLGGGEELGARERSVVAAAAGSASERTRRARFAAAMAEQRAKGGLIEEGAGEGFVFTPGARASDFAPASSAPAASAASNQSVPAPRAPPRPPPAAGGRGSGSARGARGGMGWLKKAAAASGVSDAGAMDAATRRVAALDVSGGRGGEGRGRGRGRTRGGVGGVGESRQ
jgi:E3 ubiquitin-protein ligase RNF25